MRIGLVSDTHGDPSAWTRAVEALGRLDVLLHAGDVLYHGVFNPIKDTYDPRRLADLMNAFEVATIHARGNCDSEVDQMALDNHILSDSAFISAEGLRIMVTHGHRYPEEQQVRMARRAGASVLHVGHTHLPGIRTIDGVTVVNAGSCSLPKQEDGSPTAGLIEGRTVRIIALDSGRDYAAAEIAP